MAVPWPQGCPLPAAAHYDVGRDGVVGASRHSACSLHHGDADEQVRGPAHAMLDIGVSSGKLEPPCLICPGGDQSASDVSWRAENVTDA